MLCALVLLEVAEYSNLYTQKGHSEWTNFIKQKKPHTQTAGRYGKLEFYKCELFKKQANSKPHNST
jgi:hypothetical protein